MNIHLIIGEDDFLVTEAAKRIVGDGVGLETIDSLNSGNEEQRLRDIREADASVSTPPFLDPRKVTWWKNVGFLPGGASKVVSEAVKEALLAFGERLAAMKLPENQQFILSGPKMLATSVFAKRLKTIAECLVFASGKPWEQARTASARVTELAAERGLKFESAALERFVGIVGTDTRSLLSELEKLRAYLGGKGGRVTAADVEEISSPGAGVEPVLWEVTDALGARDVAALVASVRRFEGENGFAVMMTTVVERFVRQLLELKAAESARRLAEATEGLAPFAAKKMTGFLRQWSLNELRLARARLVRLRERAVTTSGSADVLVLTELVRICRR